jgi:hypothetical protein
VTVKELRDLLARHPDEAVVVLLDRNGRDSTSYTASVGVATGEWCPAKKFRGDFFVLDPDVHGPPKAVAIWPN